MKLIATVAVCLYVVSALPAQVQDADKCADESCTISSNCRCSSRSSPIAVDDAPQLIILTIEEAVADNLFTELWQPLLFNRTNPDGAQIGGTFFVPHEYTDYRRVRDLYVNGFEIAVNSVTKNSLDQYWKNATVDTLTQEFGGQRTIISHFANIPIDDIIGARTPQLQIEGDVSVDAYKASSIQYDNSWISRSNRPFLPYTLDYLSTQVCETATICPKEPHPGFWIIPIINFQANGSVEECNALANCGLEGSGDDISGWLLSKVDTVRSDNKAPITIMVSSAFFRIVNNSFEGFGKFLDGLRSYNDVFLVSHKQAIEWIKNPVTVSQFKTDVADREAECDFPTNCNLKNADGNIRYMMSCVACPEAYPWLGNPLGESHPTPPPVTTATTKKSTLPEITTTTAATTPTTTTEPALL